MNTSGPGPISEGPVPGERPSGEQQPEQIEQRIKLARADIGLTLEALERKLAARHLVEKGLDMFKDNIGMDGVNRGLDVVRANPVPFALIGLGTAWLIANNTGVVDRIANDQRIGAARQRVSDMASDLGNRAGELASDLAGKVGIGGESSGNRALGQTGNALVDQSQQESAGWVHQVSETASGALRSARDSGGALLNRAGNLAGDGAGRVADQLGDVFNRNPLIVGAVGIMAGALLAALLPRTEVEDQLVGGTRDELFQKAEEAGEQAVAKVREVASRAAEAAVDAAKTEGSGRV